MRENARGAAAPVEKYVYRGRRLSGTEHARAAAIAVGAGLAAFYLSRILMQRRVIATASASTGAAAPRGAAERSRALASPDAGLRGGRALRG